MEALGFFQSQLIDFAVLSGNDYMANVGGLGVKTAYKLMTQFKSLEEILTVWETKEDTKKYKRDDPRNYDFNILKDRYQEIRDLYLPPEKIEFHFVESSLEQMEKQKLSELLERYGFSTTRIDNVQRRIEALLDPSNPVHSGPLPKAFSTKLAKDKWKVKNPKPKFKIK